MATIEKGAQLAYEHTDKALAWPKHFFDALLRSDWRRWVEATKKEMKGWDENNAYEEVPITDMQPGDPLVTLGELYSIKRDGRYKFRQICYGNFLEKDKGDFHDTFSTTVSQDCLRWFCALACACKPAAVITRAQLSTH